jgi:hypothetical protein
VLNTNFGSLFRLVESLDKEVAGRQTSAPPIEIQALLQELAQGRLSLPRRKKLCKELLAEPAWLAWQAERIKADRPPEANE